jgi:hypothetical protein
MEVVGLDLYVDARVARDKTPSGVQGPQGLWRWIQSTGGRVPLSQGLTGRRGLPRVFKRWRHSRRGAPWLPSACSDHNGGGLESSTTRPRDNSRRNVTKRKRRRRSSGPSSKFLAPWTRLFFASCAQAFPILRDDDRFQSHLQLAEDPLRSWTSRTAARLQTMETFTSRRAMASVDLFGPQRRRLGELDDATSR